MKRFAIAALLSTALAAAWALPTLQQVEDQVHNGNYTAALNMTAEVVAAKPDSAKAHYVYAELLAHEGRFSQASEQASRAKELDPAIGFTNPQKFADFEQLLRREAARTSGAPAAAPFVHAMPVAHSSGVPTWLWWVDRKSSCRERV